MNKKEGVILSLRKGPRRTCLLHLEDLLIPTIITEGTNQGSSVETREGTSIIVRKSTCRPEIRRGLHMGEHNSIPNRIFLISRSSLLLKEILYLALLNATRVGNLIPNIILNPNMAVIRNKIAKVCFNLMAPLM